MVRSRQRSGRPAVRARLRDRHGHFVPDDAWLVKGRWIKHLDTGCRVCEGQRDFDEAPADWLNAYRTARLLIGFLVALPVVILAVLLWTR